MCVCVCMLGQCVILRLAEAQELPIGSSHAASPCYVTMLLSLSLPLPRSLCVHMCRVLQFLLAVKLCLGGMEGLFSADVERCVESPKKMYFQSGLCLTLSVSFSPCLPCCITVFSPSIPHPLIICSIPSCDTVGRKTRFFL